MKSMNQKGFTLVELMVAGALGILLLGAVIAIYLSSKSTFVATQGIARSQETTRFAVNFLKRDIRLSGFRDCAGTSASRVHLNDAVESFPPGLENGIFGWEFSGTDAGDSYELEYDEVREPFTQAEVAQARTDNTIAAGQWSGNFIQREGTDSVRNLPALIAGFEPLRGSDILTMTISEPLDVILETQTNQMSAQLNVVDIAGDPVSSGVSQSRVLQVGDCSAIDMFQNGAGEDDSFVSLAPAGAAEPGTSVLGTFRWQKKWGAEATLYETTTKVYFVGTGAGGTPSLFVYSTNCGLVAGCQANQAELVEGVENMQILYGEDTNQDGAIDGYLSADNVVDFRDVRSVKVSLLVRSPGTSVDGPLTQVYSLNGETTIVPPVDTNQRFVNNTTVFLHNRGL